MDFDKLIEDMTQIIEAGQRPPIEVAEILRDNFTQFPVAFRNLLIDKEIIDATKCEVWSRVMGYFRPVGEWNVGKKQEHADRKHLSVEGVEGYIQE